MKPARKFSPLIRTVCGKLGLLGATAIGFNVVQDGRLQVDLIFIASLLAGFIFLYVAMFGTNPLDSRKPGDDE